MARTERRPAHRSIARPRVALRPPTDDEMRDAAAWLKDARTDSDADLLAIVDDGEPIGLLECRPGVPEDGCLRFGLVAVEPRLRGLGLGSEAVRLVEEDALKRGRARRFQADVAVDDGLGLYSWLRLGYRPARPEEDSWPGKRPSGIMSMVRRGAIAGGQGGP